MGTVVAALLAASCRSALAQCAMCKAAAASSAESASMSSGMNLAVLVLLIPPLLMFCAFFVLAYRFRKAPEDAPASRRPKENAATSSAGLIEVDKGARGGLRGKGGGPEALAKAN